MITDSITLLVKMPHQWPYQGLIGDVNSRGWHADEAAYDEVMYAAMTQGSDAQPWTAWWGQNPLTGKAYVHVSVPPRAQKSFKSCHLWDMLLPGAYFA